MTKMAAPRSGTTDRIMAAATVILALATLALALSAIFQIGVMRDQLTEMQTEQRAWVHADIAGGTDISLMDATFIFPLKFRLHNTGHLPASLVYPELEGRTYVEDTIPGPDIIAEQKRVCNTALKNFPEKNGPGVAVFPGQQIELSYEGRIKEKDWNTNQKHTTFVGCIIYYNGVGESGTTGVVFDIDQITAESPNGQRLGTSPFGLKPHVSLRTQAGAWTAK